MTTSIEAAIEAEVQRRVAEALAEQSSTPIVRTVAEACGDLRVSRSTLYGMIRDGEITPSRMTRRILIPASEIARVLAARGSAA
jgi:excisionase family DNA binding protein